MARGRKPIPVSFADLQTAIVSVEWDGPLGSRTALWKAVSQTPWAKAIKLSPQVAMLKAKGLPLMISTPVGQRGVGFQKAKPNGHNRKRSHKIPLEVVERMRKEYPESVHSMVERAARGSLKARIGLKCMDCTNMQKKEIALCTIRQCSLYESRPYKRVPSE